MLLDTFFEFLISVIIFFSSRVLAWVFLKINSLLKSFSFNLFYVSFFFFLTVLNNFYVDYLVDWLQIFAYTS